MTFRRTLLLASAAALLSAGVAYADMSGMVGNTMVVTTPDNNTIKVQLHVDGTYQTVTPGGAVKGTWKADGGKLCYTQTDPAPSADRPQPFCVDGMDGHKVGDSWSGAAGAGPAMKMSVVAGQ